MRHVRVRQAAQQDLLNIGWWYRDQSGQALADRFAAAVERTFMLLAETLGLGALAQARSSQLADARRWRVDGFSASPIFYNPRARGGISVLRVVHAAQDWKRR